MFFIEIKSHILRMTSAFHPHVLQIGPSKLIFNRKDQLGDLSRGICFKK